MDAVLLSQHLDQTSAIGGNHNFKVFPNPASENITIYHSNEKPNKIVLTDLSGKTIQINSIPFNTGKAEGV